MFDKIFTKLEKCKNKKQKKIVDFEPKQLDVSLVGMYTGSSWINAHTRKWYLVKIIDTRKHVPQYRHM